MVIRKNSVCHCSRSVSHLWTGCALVLFLSLTVLCSVTAFSGAAKRFKPPGADADQYLAIARSLASGNGYKNLVGPWRTHPDYSRMPGWPAIITIGLWAAPRVPPEAVARYANAACLSVAGVFFCALSRMLGVRSRLAVAAGLAISLSPSLVYLSVEGMSEVSFVMVLAMGMTAVFAGGRWPYAGAFILGLAPLIRTNFVLVFPIFFAVAFLFRTARRSLLSRRNLARGALVCSLALMPSLLWAVRNYRITGRFPLLSSMEGETFYGGNNDVVANNIQFWGYWVMPNEIPGESPKSELAKRLGSDLALNDYYHDKAISWMKSNITALPRLELGKFVRAFIPIPWVPSLGSYVAFSCRFILYALFFCLVPFWRRRIERSYLLMLLSISLVNILTTAIYYGVFRFTHCFIEIFLVPCIMLGLQEWWGTWNSYGARTGSPSALPTELA